MGHLRLLRKKEGVGAGGNPFMYTVYLLMCFFTPGRLNTSTTVCVSHLKNLHWRPSPHKIELPSAQRYTAPLPIQAVVSCVFWFRARRTGLGQILGVSTSFKYRNVGSKLSIETTSAVTCRICLCRWAWHSKGYAGLYICEKNILLQTSPP